MSTFWQHLWKLMGTKTLMSTAFHPQTDGQTERMHRTLAQVLRALLFNEQPELWADKLPYVELAVNSATNATTHKSAFELLYGNNVALPIDITLGTESVHPTAADFTAKIKQLVEEA